MAFDGVYGPCRGLRNAASRQLVEHGSDSATAGMSEVELMRWKIESMQRSQTDGDVENGAKNERSHDSDGHIARRITGLLGVRRN